MPEDWTDRERILIQALRDVISPVAALRRSAEECGERLSGNAYALSQDLGFIQAQASKALRDLGVI